MKQLLLISSVILLAGCASFGFNAPNCYEKVAISKIALTEAYKTAGQLTSEGVLKIKDAENTLIALDQADSATDNASSLCSIDERKAGDYLDVAKSLLDDAVNIMEIKDDE